MISDINKMEYLPNDILEKIAFYDLGLCFTLPLVVRMDGFKGIDGLKRILSNFSLCHRNTKESYYYMYNKNIEVAVRDINDTRINFKYIVFFHFISHSTSRLYINKYDFKEIETDDIEKLIEYSLI